LPAITYDMSGGFIGIHQVLQISPTGETKLSNKSTLLSTGQLDPARLQKLGQLLAAADFNNLQARYDNGKVTDDIYEAITIAPASGNGSPKTVTVAAEGGKGLTPQALSDLLKELHEIVGSLRSGAMPAST
jgi:hypothetical protein